MAEERVQRRLAAILSADVVGYSRLMEVDEEGTRARLRSLHDEWIDPRIAADGGRVVKTTGDGILVEFASAVDAVRNALAIQAMISSREAELAEDRKLAFRVGINLGDIIVEGDDIFGDGVNVAARLEALCEPGEVYVSGTVRDHVAGKLAASFEDLGERNVRNIARPIRIFRVRAEAGKTSQSVGGGAAPPLPEKPSIAVLPFTNMIHEPDQEYFCDGITEDIITALSQIRQLLVIARNTTFTLKGQSVDVQAVAKDLDVRYVLEGSVRKAGNRVRITAQLIDGASGNHLWANRYDRELEDIFALQDEITQSVVGAIQPAVVGAELERARRKSPERLDAWDLYLRGRAQYNLCTRDGVFESVSLLERAIELDPDFASAHAALALSWQRQVTVDYSDDREQAQERARRAAETAVVLDKDDAETQVALGWVLWGMGEIEESISVLQKAIDLNPSHAVAHSLLGMVLTTAGCPEEGIAHHQNAIRLSPRDPQLADMLERFAFTCNAARRYEEAVNLSKNAIRLSNGRIWLPFVNCISPLGHLGRIDEARSQIDRMRTHFPDVNIDKVRKTFRFANTEYLEHHLEGLRKAGLPE